jgi:PTH1 family peptidyl-tRNA hydrolase
MFAIVGLGNPGTTYQLTRHNAGFLVIEKVAEECGIKLNRKRFQSIYTKGTWAGRPLLLAQPQTFMNLSGQAVAALAHFYKIDPEQMLIVYDDLDLPLGTIRLRPSGGAAGHKGLASIIEKIGSNAIPRLRVGISRPTGEQPVPDYVLTKFSREEKPIFETSLERAATAALAFVSQGINHAMNSYNSIQ